MNQQLLPDKATWDAVLPVMQQRAALMREELVALQIDWPEGVKASRAVLPAIVKLACVGIRNMGLVVPRDGVTLLDHEVNGLPLVKITPIHKDARYNPEYLTDAEAAEVARAPKPRIPVHTYTKARKPRTETTMSLAFKAAGLR